MDRTMNYIPIEDYNEFCSGSGIGYLREARTLGEMVNELQAQHLRKVLDESKYNLSFNRKPMTKQEALDRIKELEKFIEEKDRKKNWVWKPSDREVYYAIRNDGGITVCDWRDSPHEEMIYSTGNMFQTQEEAQAHLDWLKARATLIRDAQKRNEGWEPDWDKSESKWSLFYDHGDKEFYAINYSYNQNNLIYFKTEDLADESASEYEEEWLTYFGIKKKRGR